MFRFRSARSSVRAFYRKKQPSKKNYKFWYEVFMSLMGFGLHILTQPLSLSFSLFLFCSHIHHRNVSAHWVESITEKKRSLRCAFFFNFVDIFVQHETFMKHYMKCEEIRFLLLNFRVWTFVEWFSWLLIIFTSFYHSLHHSNSTIIIEWAYYRERTNLRRIYNDF